MLTPNPIIRSEVKASLQEDPVYNFIYRNDRYMHEIQEQIYQLQGG